MKSYVLLLALLQSLGCSGIPQYYSEAQSMAARALGAAVAESNSVYAFSHLYRPTQGYVKRVIPTGLNTFDLLIVFDVKQTECTKASGSDPQTCAFSPGFFVPSLSCSSRVRVTTSSAQALSLKCKGDSSSSESSEEMFSKIHQFSFHFPSRAPTPSETPPVQNGHSPYIEKIKIQPRGDAFSNVLE
ncbi:secreted phosphoprotein 24 [Anabas testudineus]|uniref:Secreted phosphoprotein 24 n=1 Tax=Anabas testudineus TaxID=64144 RepID=A0A3Q1IME0_ANATE|nr:secreted phosphoprotein 24 [Anabas testudineus]